MTPNTAFPTKKTARQPSIDFLRFIAAIMVATFHWATDVGSARNTEIYGIPILGDLVKNGGFGVNIFFVISGFVIIGSAQKYNATEFIFARFIRLFPGLFLFMILVLIINTLVIGQYEKPFFTFFHSTFLTYQLVEVYPLATALWTLIVEVKFYIGVSFALFLFPKLFKSTKGIIALMILWELTIVLLEVSPLPIRTFLLPHFTLNGFSNLFALGICYYLINKIRIKANSENLLVLLVAVYFINDVFFRSGYSNILKLYMVVTSILIVLSSKLILHSSLQKVTYWLGLSSYPIYLLHQALGIGLISKLQAHITSNIFLVFGATIILITIGSALLAIFIERPIQRYFKLQFERIYQRG
jgi:peptidoglycan/LPS O-acetylase OafA/YrhL